MLRYPAAGACISYGQKLRSLHGLHAIHLWHSAGLNLICHSTHIFTYNLQDLALALDTSVEEFRQAKSFASGQGSVHTQPHQHSFALVRGQIWPGHELAASKRYKNSHTPSAEGGLNKNSFCGSTAKDGLVFFLIGDYSRLNLNAFGSQGMKHQGNRRCQSHQTSAEFGTP